MCERFAETEVSSVHSVQRGLNDLPALLRSR